MSNNDTMPTSNHLRQVFQARQERQRNRLLKPNAHAPAHPETTAQSAIPPGNAGAGCGLPLPRLPTTAQAFGDYVRASRWGRRGVHIPMPGDGTVRLPRGHVLDGLEVYPLPIIVR